MAATALPSISASHTQRARDIQDLGLQDVALNTAPSETQTKTGHVVSRWRHLLAVPVSSYVTEGLAKIFGFEMLRHGTSFPNYMGILENGADPLMGGKGSSAAEPADAVTTVNGVPNETTHKTYSERCQGYFHVFKDTDARLVDDSCNIDSPFAGQIMKRAYPRMHAVLAGVAAAKDVENDTARCAAATFSGIGNFFCPTIAFMYRKSEIDGTAGQPALFETDPDYNGLAYRTTQVLSNDRIGLVGMCEHATMEDAKRSWATNPWEFIAGIIQLFVGILFTLTGIGLFL